jgi:hemolysin III
VGIAGLAVLVFAASRQGDALRIVSVSIYGATLVLLYLSSVFYHSFRSARLKRFPQIADHAAIYLLIAGTYTPFTLISLRGAWGWTIFGIIWGLAAAGILSSSYSSVAGRRSRSFFTCLWAS